MCVLWTHDSEISLSYAISYNIFKKESLHITMDVQFYINNSWQMISVLPFVLKKNRSILSWSISQYFFLFIYFIPCSPKCFYNVLQMSFSHMCSNPLSVLGWHMFHILRQEYPGQCWTLLEPSISEQHCSDPPASEHLSWPAYCLNS